MKTLPADKTLKVSLWTRKALLDSMYLNAVQAALNDIAPHWAKNVRICFDEEEKLYSRRIDFGTEGALFDAVEELVNEESTLDHELIQSEASERPAFDRKTSLVELVGGHSAFVLFLDVDDYPLSPRLDTWYMGNRLALEIASESVERQRAASFARSALERLAEALPFDFGNARSAGEFRAKNMLFEEGGVRAVDQDISKALPGFYWLNFFGSIYCDLIKRERLLRAPSHRAYKVDDGVIIQSYEDPWMWMTEGYQQGEQRVVEYIGQQYFFSKDAPNRSTEAPKLAYPG